MYSPVGRVLDISSFRYHKQFWCKQPFTYLFVKEILQGMFLGMGMLDITKLLSKVVPIYIPINSMREFLLLHILPTVGIVRL